MKKPTLTDLTAYGAGGILGFLLTTRAEANGFTKTATTLNQQIENDFDWLGHHPQLPNTPPPLPLTPTPPRGKGRLMLRCWLIGSLATLAVVAPVLFLLTVTVARPDSGDPIAYGLVGGLGIGFGAAILGGWFPGALLFLYAGSRENARRSSEVALAQFRDYWTLREHARVALAQGRASTAQVCNDLWSFRIPLDADEQPANLQATF